MVQLVDIFAKPMVMLLRELINTFQENNIKFNAESVFVDVEDSIREAHPHFHQQVIQNPGRYLEKNPSLLPFLKRLRDNGKTVFLITNSPFVLVNAGMTYLIGEDWRDIFDVIITNAKKPAFFTHQLRHLREYNPETKILSWGEVNQVLPGKVYSRVRTKLCCPPARSSS